MKIDKEISRATNAATIGNISAMIELAGLLVGKNDLDGAEKWYRQAVEAGNTNAMSGLGNVLTRKGDLDGAEKWYRQAVEAGNTNAMSGLGNVLTRKGDLDGAEKWYRQAVEAGNTNAMSGLGNVLTRKGDLDGAEKWYRQAVEAGDASAIEGLGGVLRRKGDLEGAEKWYRQAAEAGSAKAMWDLGYVLTRRGDLEGAEKWYRQAAEAGSTKAMASLGVLLGEKGDLDGAEKWYREAAEAGDALAMNNLGIVLRDKGDVDQALVWLERAVEGGDEYALANLTDLQDKKLLNYHLDLLIFDTFEWTLSQNGEGTRQWRFGNAVLSERFFGFRPDIQSLDCNRIRENLSGFQEQPGLSAIIGHLNFLESMEGGKIPERSPQEFKLLDVERFDAGSAKCLMLITRHEVGSEVHYSAAVLLLFAECFWVINIEVRDRQYEHRREQAVAKEVLRSAATIDTLSDDADPYGRQWDGIVALKDDPLSRLRILLSKLRASIRFGPDIYRFRSFTYGD